MKLSLNWIKDFISLPDDIDMAKLAYDLTMSTVEVEGVEDLGASFKNIVVGIIKEVNPHPNADKLRVCMVDIGDTELKQIVCGGSNLEVGQKVVVSCPGAMVRWHGEGEPVEIKNSKLRGVASFGMICASEEVGLSDLFPAAGEHEIMDLSHLDVPAGTNVADALNLRDAILEIDNKSMTNRPDLWGHYGIARELSALYGLPLKKIEKYVPETTEEYDVRILDEQGCPRYIGAKIEGLSVKPSPFEMQSRLWRVGMRPINALVDVTNYVMLATGQPTHVFDSDHIVDHIEIRKAVPGEKLKLLNDKEIKLAADDIVIADAEGPVALAGVMGGGKDSVLPDTKSVILEVANFDHRSVRRTALRYDNRTEASTRFEKAIDPERCDLALSMITEMLKDLYPEMKVTAFKDNRVKAPVRNEIDVEFDWLDRRLGMRIPQDVLADKLGRLGFEIDFSETGMHITVPTWRSTGDVSIKADIMEEVARMYGYENFEVGNINVSFDAAVNQLDTDLIRRVKEYLAIRCEMQEIFTYPWMSEEFVEAILPSTEGILALATPPAPGEKYVRSSLLPNICKAIVKNERSFEKFDIFEEARVFMDKDYTEAYKGEKLPMQKKHLGCAFVGSSADIAGLFRRAKGVIGNMPRYTHMEAFTFEKVEKPHWADETVWLNIMLGGKKIGDLGLLSKKAALACGIKVLSAVLVEMDVEELIPLTSRTNRFEKLPEFPESDYDISFLIDSMVKWDEIYSCIMGKKNELLKDARFVDEYRGKQIPEGKKSVTVRLVIGAPDRTLTGADIESAAKSVIKRLSKTLGADIRSA